MSGPYRFGRCEVRPTERLLLVDGKPAVLGARAFDLVLALIERRDRVTGKNELFDLVWPGVIVEENNLQVQISALRKLLGPQAITTVPGRGYRFTAALDAGTGEGPSPAASAVSSTPAPEPAAPGNLPPHLPLLIGRDEDLRSLLGLVDAHPLVTVVGAGGMGKTMLATAAAHALRGGFRDGAWLVELAPVTDPAQVPQAVAQALRITLSGAGTAQEQLVSVLGSQSLLLVLDNCEHVVEAAGELAEAIVNRAPGVRLLATSQELLNVPDEKLFRLSPLAVPAAGETRNPEQFGALRLFAERAQAVDPRFVLNAGNAQVVADICRRLDGMPLAIELAAARVRLLGVQGVRDKLSESFRVLTGGARTAMRRHQTLHATIDWSYALLSAGEQAVLRRLGAFVGGFTLELAQQVAGDAQLDEWAVLDALSALVDKSLVTADSGEPPRYRLLETTRAYALEKLADVVETAALIERHARVICELFVQTEEARFGEHGTLSMDAFLQRLGPELDNLRAALDWSMGAPGDAATAVALAGASAEVFRCLGLAQEALRFMQPLRGRLSEGLNDLVDPERAAVFLQGLGMLGAGAGLPKATTLDAHARAERIIRQRGSRRRLYRNLYGTAFALNTFGHYAEAEAMLPEMLALEDPAWPGWVRGQRLNLLSAICNAQGRFEASLRLLTEQRALLERERGDEALLSVCLTNVCLALVSLQRYEEAVTLALSLIAHGRGDQRFSVSIPMQHLTSSLVLMGRLDEADQAMRQAMPVWRRAGNFLYHCGVLALLLARQGRYADAARVDGAGVAFVRRSGVAHLAVWKRARLQMQQLFEAAALKPEDLERWRQEGELLDEAAIAALCLGEGGPAAAATPLSMASQPAPKA